MVCHTVTLAYPRVATMAKENFIVVEEILGFGECKCVRVRRMVAGEERRKQESLVFAIYIPHER